MSVDYLFRLKDKPPFPVKCWGNLPMELLAALAGVKPVIQCWVDDSDLPYIEQLCAAFGLRRHLFSRVREGERSRCGLMLGFEAERLKETARDWQRPQSNPGVLLGYPRCCVDFYCAWLRRARPCPDIIRFVHANTRPLGELPFLLNNVFYHYSRPWSPGDPEARQEMALLNPGLNLDLLNMVSWHPCSFRCPESLRKATAIWKTAGEVLPGLREALQERLAHPMLFWDWNRFVVLDGVCEGGGCRFSGVRGPFSKAGQESLALLREGTAVRPAAGGKMAVWKASRKIGVLADDPILLEFSAGRSSRPAAA